MVHLDVRKVWCIRRLRRLAHPRVRIGPGQSRRAGQVQGRPGRLHRPAHRHRRVLPPRLHRSPAQRDRSNHDRVLGQGQGERVLRSPLHHAVHASGDRHRVELPRQGLPSHRLPPPAHPPSRAQAQRESWQWRGAGDVVVLLEPGATLASEWSVWGSAPTSILIGRSTSWMHLM